MFRNRAPWDEEEVVFLLTWIALTALGVAAYASAFGL